MGPWQKVGDVGVKGVEGRRMWFWMGGRGAGGGFGGAPRARDGSIVRGEISGIVGRNCAARELARLRVGRGGEGKVKSSMTIALFGPGGADRSGI